MNLTSQATNKISEILIEQLSAEFIKQGHNLSGAGLASISVQFTPNTIKGFMEEYMVIQNYGVSASRIPYSGRSGSGGTSQYITGLMQFALARGMASNNNEAKGVAFAIANKQKNEGMPTGGSFKYSLNGRRTGWIDRGLAKAVPMIGQVLIDMFKEKLR